MGALASWVILSLSGVAVIVTIWAAVTALRGYWLGRGKRLVACPETHCPAAVELDAKTAALRAIHWQTEPHLGDCSRWPEKADCAQDCLQEIEALGSACLVRTIVGSWYQGKSCVYCHKPLDKAEEWTGHIPALLGPDERTVPWKEIPSERLPEVFQKYQPVCWSCHIAETFRREHAELVTDRPARW